MVVVAVVFGRILVVGVGGLVAGAALCSKIWASVSHRRFLQPVASMPWWASALVIKNQIQRNLIV